MVFVDLQMRDGIAVLALKRGKVNAINGMVVDELRAKLKAIEGDPAVRAVVLTGTGKFFSFGFDIPEFLSFSREQFAAFLTNFTDLYTYVFVYPKPVVAALNGHTIAGGCMLASACDYRVMASGKAKISLNEIRFGSSVFAGSTEILRYWVGSANATAILFSGDMYSAEEAVKMRLVQEVTTEEGLMDAAYQAASGFASKHQPAFAGIKSLLRKSIADEMRSREADSIREFVDIWYSEATWTNVNNIKIR